MVAVGGEAAEAWQAVTAVQSTLGRLAPLRDQLTALDAAIEEAKEDGRKELGRQLAEGWTDIEAVMPLVESGAPDSIVRALVNAGLGFDLARACRPRAVTVRLVAELEEKVDNALDRVRSLVVAVLGRKGAADGDDIDAATESECA